MGKTFVRLKMYNSSRAFSKTSNLSAATIGPARSESRQDEKIIEKQSSKRLTRPIFTEKTLRKNSKFVISTEDEWNLLRVFSTEKTSSVLPHRSSEQENRRSKISENRDSSTFSFGYGARALVDATQRISLVNKDLLDIPEYELDKENSWQYKVIRPGSNKRTDTKISRLYHPGGSIKFSRPDLSMDPLSIKRAEYYQGFPYIFAGTGKAAAAAGLDNLSNN